MAHRSAHRLHACIFNKIGMFFSAVKSCNLFCGKRLSKNLPHRVFIYGGKHVYKKIVSLCIFFCRKGMCKKNCQVGCFFFVGMRVMCLHDSPQKKYYKT